jgi:hypothetical protein
MTTTTTKSQTNGKPPAPPATPIRVDQLTLDEIDQWEAATGLEFQTARQFQQVGAALWVQAALRDGEQITPKDVMRRVTMADLPTLVEVPGADLDPTIQGPGGGP